MIPWWKSEGVSSIALYTMFVLFCFSHVAVVRWAL